MSMKAIIEKEVISQPNRFGYVNKCDNRLDRKTVVIRFLSIPVYRKEIIIKGGEK